MPPSFPVGVYRQLVRTAQVSNCHLRVTWGVPNSYPHGIPAGQLPSRRRSWNWSTPSVYTARRYRGGCICLETAEPPGVWLLQRIIPVGSARFALRRCSVYQVSEGLDVNLFPLLSLQAKEERSSNFPSVRNPAVECHRPFPRFLTFFHQAA
jgi:hypothetical protein